MVGIEERSAENTTGLMYQEQASCRIPRRQVKFPITVEPSASHPREIQHCGSEPAYAANGPEHVAHSLGVGGPVDVAVVGEPRSDHGLDQIGLTGYAYGFAVEVGTLTRSGTEHFGSHYIDDSACERLIAFPQGDRNANVRYALEEIDGSVQRIDYPLPGASVTPPAAFLGEDRIGRPMLCDHLENGYLGSPIDLADRIHCSLELLDYGQTERIANDDGSGACRGGSQLAVGQGSVSHERNATSWSSASG